MYRCVKCKKAPQTIRKQKQINISETKRKMVDTKINKVQMLKNIAYVVIILFSSIYIIDSYENIYSHLDETDLKHDPYEIKVQKALSRLETVNITLSGVNISFCAIAITVCMLSLITENDIKLRRFIK